MTPWSEHMIATCINAVFDVGNARVSFTYRSAIIITCWSKFAVRDSQLRMSGAINFKGPDGGHIWCGHSSFLRKLSRAQLLSLSTVSYTALALRDQMSSSLRVKHSSLSRVSNNRWVTQKGKALFFVMLAALLFGCIRSPWSAGQWIRIGWYYTLNVAV